MRIKNENLKISISKKVPCWYVPASRLRPEPDSCATSLFYEGDEVAADWWGYPVQQMAHRYAEYDGNGTNPLEYDVV